MPVLHIGLVGTAYPEVIAHDFGIDIEGVILSQSPVWPVDRVVCGIQRLIDMGICGIIFFEVFT